MDTSEFVPTVYMKTDCPFCMKVRIFLAEAGLYDKVRIHEFAPNTEQEQAIRDELSPHFENITFPSAETSFGQYTNESDTIIARLAEGSNADPKTMPVLRSYADDVLPVFRKIYIENRELKKNLA